jgi:hypothetical protein
MVQILQELQDWSRSRLLTVFPSAVAAYLQILQRFWLRARSFQHDNWTTASVP